jgi:hypothetical protein
MLWRPLSKINPSSSITSSHPCKLHKTSTWQSHFVCSLLCDIWKTLSINITDHKTSKTWFPNNGGTSWVNNPLAAWLLAPKKLSTPSCWCWTHWLWKPLLAWCTKDCTQLSCVLCCQHWTSCLTPCSWSACEISISLKWVMVKLRSILKDAYTHTLPPRTQAMHATIYLPSTFLMC